MSKIVKSESASPQAEPLKWVVFVTPPIPIAQAQRPEGVSETFFQATASTLIYGKRDAVLVDAFMTVKQATALADWVASKHKNLTTIYITHGHGDHIGDEHVTVTDDRHSRDVDHGRHRHFPGDSGE